MTRDDLIERIARVLCEYEGYDLNIETWPGMREGYCAAAAAIVDVLPTMADPVTDAEEGAAFEVFCEQATSTTRNRLRAALEAFAAGRVAVPSKPEPVVAPEVPEGVRINAEAIESLKQRLALVTEAVRKLAAR